MDASGYEDALREVTAAAKETWPELSVPDDVFREHLLARLPKDAGADQLRALCAPDLYLACACARRFDGALEAFERAYAPVIARAVGRLDGGSAIADDVAQVVRHILFVGAGDSEPAIARYSGRGNLRAWIRIISVREGLRILRKFRGRVGVQDEALYDALTPSDGADPHLERLKTEYRGEFRKAFRAAVEALPRRERTALRLSVLDGLSIDEIAPIYKVHRATAARWLSRARESLLKGTRKRLGEELGMGPAEVDSVIRLIGSNLEMSLHSVLRSRERE